MLKIFEPLWIDISERKLILSDKSENNTVLLLVGVRVFCWLVIIATITSMAVTVIRIMSLFAFIIEITEPYAYFRK